MDTVTNQSDGGFAPPPAMKVVTPLAPAQQVVATGTNAADQTTVVSHRQRFNTAGVVCAIAGAAILVVLSGIAATRLGSEFGTVPRPAVESILRPELLLSTVRRARQRCPDHWAVQTHGN